MGSLIGLGKEGEGYWVVAVAIICGEAGAWLRSFLAQSVLHKCLHVEELRSWIFRPFNERLMGHVAESMYVLMDVTRRD